MVKGEELGPLHRDAHRNSYVWIPGVIQVVAVVDVSDINIVGVVPVVRPVFRPWIDRTEPIALVLEAWISANNEEREAIDPEAVVRPKISAVPVVRNTVAVVPPPLFPRAVV